MSTPPPSASSSTDKFPDVDPLKVLKDKLEEIDGDQINLSSSAAIYTPEKENYVYLFSSYKFNPHFLQMDEADKKYIMRTAALNFAIMSAKFVNITEGTLVKACIARGVCAAMGLYPVNRNENGGLKPEVKILGTDLNETPYSAIQGECAKKYTDADFKTVTKPLGDSKAVELIANVKNEVGLVAINRLRYAHLLTDETENAAKKILSSCKRVKDFTIDPKAFRLAYHALGLRGVTKFALDNAGSFEKPIMVRLKSAPMGAAAPFIVEACKMGMKSSIYAAPIVTALRSIFDINAATVAKIQKNPLGYAEHSSMFGEAKEKWDEEEVRTLAPVCFAFIKASFAQGTLDKQKALNKYSEAAGSIAEEWADVFDKARKKAVEAADINEIATKTLAAYKKA